jgi:hypothetical protein
MVVSIRFRSAFRQPVCSAADFAAREKPRHFSGLPLLVSVFIKLSTDNSGAFAVRTAPVWSTLARRFVCAMGVLLVATSSGLADVRIRSSPGGEVISYLRFFEIIRNSGDRVIIDGPCLSACTLVLSVVPNDRICVTRRAVLGFHAAAAVDESGERYAIPATTRLIAQTYPPPVRAWIYRHGGLSGRLLLLRGRELAAIFPSCR